MIISVDDSGYIMVSQFSGLLDITKVEYYSLDLNSDNTLTLKFYDLEKRLIKFYGKIQDPLKRTRTTSARSKESKSRKQTPKTPVDSRGEKSSSSD